MGPMGETPWFREGLRFECHRCGHCCRGAGQVWLRDQDAAALAGELGIDADELRQTYTRRAGRRGVVLREKRNKDCVFWDERAGCRVYRARPLQCRTYPFWSAIVQSQESWEQEGASCPGLGKGRLHAAAEVASMACDDGIPPSRTRERMRARGARCE